MALVLVVLLIGLLIGIVWPSWVWHTTTNGAIASASAKSAARPRPGRQRKSFSSPQAPKSRLPGAHQTERASDPSVPLAGRRYLVSRRSFSALAR